MASPYVRSLTAAAERLLEFQSFDGGWGVKPTAVSSIVNTAEAITVLRAAGVEYGQSLERAGLYIASSLSDHTRPRGRDGGRGENTRFVAFGIEGLLTYPELLNNSTAQDALGWAVRWLQAACGDEGWPETLGTHEASLHQTALVAMNVARAVSLFEGTGHRVESYVTEMRGIVSTAAKSLLRFRRGDGSFPVRTYTDTASSPSKSALAAVAFAYAADVLGDDEFEWGGADREGVAKPDDWISLPEARDTAARWLEGDEARWGTLVEQDVDVQGTTWLHLAYAQCLRGIGVSGIPDQGLVKRRLKYLQSRWSGEHRLWTEPPLGEVTIRAAYHTVWAQESFREGSLLQFPTQPSPPEGVPSKAQLLLDAASVRLVVQDQAATLDLNERESLLVRQIPRQPSTADISAALGLAASSVAKTVDRLNLKLRDAATELGAETIGAAVVSTATQDRSGRRRYRWSMSPEWRIESG